jgi:hypothetical protein
MVRCSYDRLYWLGPCVEAVGWAMSLMPSGFTKLPVRAGFIVAAALVYGTGVARDVGWLTRWITSLRWG